MTDITDILLTDDFPEEVPEGIAPQIWQKWKDETERRKDPFLSELNRSLAGQNIGLENGLERVNKSIYGTHKARYYLIGAESSVGKTTIADFMFVLNAWLSAKKQGRRIRIFYLSFEIGKTQKLFRWCSYFIFIKTGLRLSSDYIQGRIEGRKVNDAHLKIILEAYSVITEMLKDVDVVQNVISPTEIFQHLVTEWFDKNGTIKRVPVSKEDELAGKKGLIIGYEENDPMLMTLIVTDHIALSEEEGLGTKNVMDKWSRFCIVLRNIFFATIVNIQQFSTDMMATYRSAFGKKKEAPLQPQRIDFGDSKATYRDADVVFGGIKPTEGEQYMNYNITRDGLGDYFVAWYLMKNRYGPANKMLPLFLDPVSGFVYDLPAEPLNLMAMETWYDKAKQIDKICKEYFPLPLSQLQG